MENTAQNFSSSFLSTPPREDAEHFLNRMKIRYEHRDDGSLVIHGNIDLSRINPVQVPDFSNAMVFGNFTCGGNMRGSLQGSPKAVVGDFICDRMNLTSLAGGPEMVWGNYSCVGNRLDTLEHAPKFVDGDFHCMHNELKSLARAPANVEGNFYCQHNKLNSIEGAPEKVGKDFFCYDNAANIADLEHLPEVRGRVHTGPHVFEKGGPRVIPVTRVAPQIAPSQETVSAANPGLNVSNDEVPGPAASRFTSPDAIAALLNAHNLKNIDRNLVKVADVSAHPEQGVLLRLESERTLHLGKQKDGLEFIGMPDASARMERTEAAAIISLGKSRGWADIQIQGSDRDKALLCMEAEKQGVKVSNPPPQDVMAKFRQKFEAGTSAQQPAPQRVASRAGAPRM